ncbi:MAG: hypothetical protein ABIT01_20245 [Thermoanaerobaculia bacterium]
MVNGTLTTNITGSPANQASGGGDSAGIFITTDARVTDSAAAINIDNSGRGDAIHVEADPDTSYYSTPPGTLSGTLDMVNGSPTVTAHSGSAFNTGWVGDAITFGGVPYMILSASTSTLTVTPTPSSTSSSVAYVVTTGAIGNSGLAVDINRSNNAGFNGNGIIMVNHSTKRSKQFGICYCKREHERFCSSESSCR